MNYPGNETLLRVLYAGTSVEDETLIRQVLKRDGFNVVMHRVESEAALTLALGREMWEIVLCDSFMSSFPALKVLDLIKGRMQEIPFIVLFESLDEELAIEIVRASGPREFVMKSKIDTDLAASVKRTLRQAGKDLQGRLNAEQESQATMESWGRALELRDPGTNGHTLRVTDLTMRLCKRMRVHEDYYVKIHRGALLHDIGKMGIPDSILLKPGPLTDGEWAVMRTHPRLAMELLMPSRALREYVNIPWCHHEKFNGTGYPRGLIGANIPIDARIFAVADVYDALTSDRPYRKAWTAGEALKYIESESGESFDQTVVHVFTRMEQEE